MTDKREGDCASFKPMEISWCQEYARNVNASAPHCQHAQQQPIQNHNQYIFNEGLSGCEGLIAEQQGGDVIYSVNPEIPPICTTVL